MALAFRQKEIGDPFECCVHLAFIPKNDVFNTQGRFPVRNEEAIDVSGVETAFAVGTIFTEQIIEALVDEGVAQAARSRQQRIIGPLAAEAEIGEAGAQVGGPDAQQW